MHGSTVRQSPQLPQRSAVLRSRDDGQRDIFSPSDCLMHLLHWDLSALESRTTSRLDFFLYQLPDLSKIAEAMDEEVSIPVFPGKFGDDGFSSLLLSRETWLEKQPGS